MLIANSGAIQDQFFPGFSWALPAAFSDAASACKFEEGDVLYSTESAYKDDWNPESQEFDCYQVKYPKRTRTSASDSDSGVFASNWQSELRETVLNSV